MVVHHGLGTRLVRASTKKSARCYQTDFSSDFFPAGHDTIGVVAPLHSAPLLESHVVVYGQQRNSYSHTENTGGIDLARVKRRAGRYSMNTL